ncbi:hypothetical protein D3C81_762900 [compost metagenome]
MFHQETTEHGTEGGTARGDGRPHADGERTLAVVGKGQADDGQGGRHHQRGADGQQHAGKDQPFGRGRKRGAQRGDAEHGQAGEENGFMAEAVTEGAEAGQQAGDDQRIHVDDPQFLRGRCLQVARQRGQGGVEHGHVDHDQEQGAGDDGQRQPFFH